MKRLEKIANEIVELEKQCKNGKEDYFMRKMAEIIMNLTPEELLFIDEYITKNNLLKE